MSKLQSQRSAAEKIKEVQQATQEYISRPALLHTT